MLKKVSQSMAIDSATNSSCYERDLHDSVYNLINKVEDKLRKKQLKQWKRDTKF